MSLGVVVLAAGKGTRMRSARPKVLHTVAGRPMIGHVLEATARLATPPARIAVVIGHGAEEVRAAAEAVNSHRLLPSAVQFGDDEDAARVALEAGQAYRSLRFALQAEQRGTGHAVACAAEVLDDPAIDTVLVLFGDVPLLESETLDRLLAHHAAGDARLTLLSARVVDPRGYGRIVRDRSDDQEPARSMRISHADAQASGVAGDGTWDLRPVRRIVEEVDATAEERAIDEINTGVMAVDASWLWPALAALEPSASGEIYLTDLVAKAVAEGGAVGALVAEDARSWLGVNDRAGQAEAERRMRERIRAAHLAAGVTMIDPATTWIDAGVEIAADCEIWPGSYLLGRTVLAEGCRIGPGSLLRDVSVGARCEIELSVVEQARLGDDCHVGPFAHLRPGAELAEGVHVGNYAEIKNSRLGAGVRTGHFSYLGDATVGAGANIGAGTVTCNYDGRAKHPTVVGAGAFVGSDTMLVAPVTLGEGARTGAGSVVTRDVAAGETVAGVPARPLRARRAGLGLIEGAADLSMAEAADERASNRASEHGPETTDDEDGGSRA